MTSLRASIAVALLAGTALLAFFSGGYFDRPRLWGAAVAWVAVGLAAVACRRPWPSGGSAWLAVAGLAGLTAWTAASISWAPLRDVAQADTQRLLLYLGVFVAGIAVFAHRALARAVEPALALGALAAVVEGLSERLLPALFTLEAAGTGTGRLFQPVTYWNAMGLLAAMGFVLCVRVAGDVSRPRWMRAAAAASGPWLAAGGYLTLSRGAVLAVAVGLALLALVRPSRAQLRAIGLLCLASAPPMVAAALLPAARNLEGSASARDTQGLILLAVLVLSALGAGVLARRGARAPASEELAVGVSPWARRATRAAAVAVAVGVVAVFAVLVADLDEPAVVPIEDRAQGSRLASPDSIRGSFWQVAADAFAREPVRGVGSGGYAVEWLRERTVLYAARDAHSLYVETAAELGLVGLALLAVFLAGIARSAVLAHRADPALAAGPIAVTGLWAVHAGVDWDWELPAVTLVALVLASVLAGRRDGPPGDDRDHVAEPGPVTAREPARAGAVS